MVGRSQAIWALGGRGSQVGLGGACGGGGAGAAGYAEEPEEEPEEEGDEGEDGDGDWGGGAEATVIRSGIRSLAR